MTDEILSRLISAEIDKVVSANVDTITSKLTACVDSDEVLDPVVAKMAVASIRLSTQISTQFIMEFLHQSGVITLPPDGTPLISLADED